MTLSEAAGLVAEIRALGVAIEVVGEKLRFRPVRSVPTELRQRLRDAKPDVLQFLHEESFRADAGDGRHPSVARCGSCGESDFTRPRAGGTWRCARCRPYDLPGGDIEWWPRVGDAVPFAASDVLGGSDTRDNGPAPMRPSCYCCGSRRFWRLRSGGDWVCPRCHPPLVDPGEIETWEAAP